MADEKEIDRKAREIKRLRKKLADLDRTHAAARTANKADKGAIRAVRKKAAPAKKPEAKKNIRPIVYQRDLPRHTSVPQPSRKPTFTVELDKAVHGREVTHAQRGKAFLISRRVPEIDGAELISAAFAEKLQHSDSPLCARLRILSGDKAYAPEDMVFMDVESTGLSNAPLFLIGTMIWENCGFEIRQFFARNYAEEAAVIALFSDICRGRCLLVTFNGKTFDMPYIRQRAIIHGQPLEEIAAHFDLLHESRRIWKGRLPNCRLQTLEAYVCGRARYDDIPGNLIPEAYHEYVRTENAWQVAEILKHNLLDLVTMADIMSRFPPATDNAEKPL